MKLIDAIRNVRRPEAKTSYDFSAPLEEICRDLDIQYFYESMPELDHRLKAYPIMDWYCTDQHVGLYALYLDGNPVGCTYQEARKSDTDVEWISQELAEEVGSVIRSYLRRDAKVTVLNPDDEIGETYSRRFQSEVMRDDGFYQGRPVKILIRYDRYCRSTEPKYRHADRSYTIKAEDQEKHDHVLIQDGDETRLIHIRDFSLAYHVNEVPDDAKV